MRNELLADDVAVTNLCIIALIIGMVVFIILRYMKDARDCSEENKKKLKIAAISALLIYLVIVFYATLACRSQYESSHSSLKVFATIKEAFKGSVPAQNDVIQNLLFFMPFGFLLQFLSEKRLRWYVAIPLMCLYSCGIETAQYITKLGVAQVDDVICNTISGTAGYILACGFTNLIHRMYNTEKKN